MILILTCFISSAGHMHVSIDGSLNDMVLHKELPFEACRQSFYIMFQVSTPNEISSQIIAPKQLCLGVIRTDHLKKIVDSIMMTISV